MTGSAYTYDLHTHTTFSDGSEMGQMIAAAEDVGLDGIGFTDHCILIEDEFGRRNAYDLVETYEHRRERITAAQRTTDVQLFDAVELSYVPGTDAEIRTFLQEAAFEYAIGAVHFAETYDYTSGGAYADASETTVQGAVDTYYETLVELIESELFDVVAHLDLPERHPVLRGRTTEAHYRALAAAFESSRSVPELNAGRVFRSLGRLHPNPAMMELFVERDIEFTLGTDSHTPGELRRRVPYVREFVDDRQTLSTCTPDAIGAEPTASGEPV
jgi:histidinol-phosphatase (PHP family)